MARVLLVCGLASVALVPGCGSNLADPSDGDDPAHAPAESGESKLTDVTLQLNWFPEAEHGGYYAALVHGDYRAAGLNVKIVSGGPETPVVQQVARRSVTFGVVNADNVLFGRAQQAPVVALMAPLQISPRCLIVHESSGIRGFEDLKDMTIAMSTSNAFSHYLRYKLPLLNVKIVPYPGNVAQFLLNKDYAQQGYVFSEPFVARKEGGDPRVLMISDLGFNPYTSLLFTHADQVGENPELVAKMVAASVRGWERYIRAPEETNRYIHRVNPQMDLDILAYGAKTLEPLVLDPVAEREGIGTMSADRWQQLADQLVESKQLRREDALVAGAFTTRFLPTEK
ncbi:MAG: ABC transporter substrate-binding protein [Pirellulales bacterium]